MAPNDTFGALVPNLLKAANGCDETSRLVTSIITHALCMQRGAPSISGRPTFVYTYLSLGPGTYYHP